MCIKETIREYGFTYEQLAVKLGRSKVRVVQIANSDNINTETLQRWADAIGCKRGDFFRDEMTVTKGTPVIQELHTTCPKCQGNIKVELKISED